MRIVLTRNQWGRISELLGSLGIAILASTSIPALFDNFNLRVVILGLLMGSISVYLSILSARKY